MDFESDSEINRHTNFRTFMQSLILLFRWVMSSSLSHQRVKEIRRNCSFKLKKIHFFATKLVVVFPNKDWNKKKINKSKEFVTKTNNKLSVLSMAYKNRYILFINVLFATIWLFFVCCQTSLSYKLLSNYYYFYY